MLIDETQHDFIFVDDRLNLELERQERLLFRHYSALTRQAITLKL